MFALLSARFRRLLFFMIAVPVGGRLLEAVGRRLEASSGPTRVSRALRSGGQAAGRLSRGPLRPRNAAPDSRAARAPATAPGSGLNGSSPASGRRSSMHRRSRR